MLGQITLDDFIREEVANNEEYEYVAPNGKWDETCASCSKWNFSFKGVRCEYPGCRNDNHRNFENMLRTK